MPIQTYIFYCQEHFILTMMMSWTSEEINKLSRWRGINKRQCYAELIQVLLHLIQFNSDSNIRKYFAMKQ